jgi:hypothetical protein
MDSSNYKDINAFDEGKTFTLVDQFTLILAVILVITGSYLLFKHNDAELNLRDLNPIASVTRVESNPKRKIVGTLNYTELVKEMDLFRGDQILTDENSEAEVYLEDNTRIRVPPNSLVKIDFSNETFSLDLIRGVVDVKLTKSSRAVEIGKGKEKYSLKAKDAELKIIKSKKGLNFQKKKGKVDIFKKSALKGIEKKAVVKIEKPTVPFIVSPKDGTAIAPSKRARIKISLSKKGEGTVLIGKRADFKNAQEFPLNGIEKFIKTPRPGMYYIAFEDNKGNLSDLSEFKVMNFSAPILDQISPLTEIIEGESIKFRWSQLGDYGYETQVRGPSGKIFNIKTSVPSLKFIPKKEGKISLRTRVKSKNSPWSSWGETQIGFRLGLTVPENLKNQLVELAFDKKTKLIIGVKKATQKGLYSFSMARDQEFKDIFFEKKSKKSKIGVFPKETGILYWRVKKTGKLSLSSPIETLRIKAPVGRASKRNYRSVQVVNVKEKIPLRINWEFFPGVKKAILEFSKEKEMLNIFDRLEVSGNRGVTYTADELGQYYWRLKAIEGQDDLVTSQAYSLRATLPSEIKVPRYEKRLIIDYKRIGKKNSYQIKLIKQKTVKFYYVEVYNDKKRSRRLFQKKLRRPVAYWVSNRSGRFYYRYKVEDEWGRQSEFTPMGELIFPISPLLKLK